MNFKRFNVCVYCVFAKINNFKAYSQRLYHKLGKHNSDTHISTSGENNQGRIVPRGFLADDLKGFQKIFIFCLGKYRKRKMKTKSELTT